MLASPNRCGLVNLPPAVKRNVSVACVPTTIGTGAEQSARAVLTEQVGRRLVIGEPIYPDLAVIDPRFTATLPKHLRTEGAFEALFRVVTLLVDDGWGAVIENDLALTLAKHAFIAACESSMVRAFGRFNMRTIIRGVR